MNQTLVPRQRMSPIELCWLGWRTNIHELSRAGWQISAKEDIQRDRLNIALNHPKARVQGYADMNYAYQHQYSSLDYTKIIISFKLAHRISIQAHNLFSKNLTWQAIGPDHNSYSYDFTQTHNLEDLALFKPLSSKDIILTEPSFNEVLQMALNHQAPKQKELREKARNKMGAILRVAV